MINFCLFPVAGFGTRFLPVTKVVPKELLPIISTPLIEYSISEAAECKISNFIFVSNKYKSAIKEYFESHKYLESIVAGTEKESCLLNIENLVKNSQLSFINQSQMLGLGHAILQGKELIGNNPFAVILPDDLCYTKSDSVLMQMIKVSSQFPDKSIVAIEEVSKKDVCKYGVIKGKSITPDKTLFSIDEMIEKPSIEEAPSNLAIIGRYILQPDIFQEIEKINIDNRGEIQITDALNNLAKKGKVLAYKFSGIRMDCGTFEGYLSANNFFNNLR